MKFRVELRGNDDDAGSGREERLDLAQRNAATAHNEDIFTLEVEFDGEEGRGSGPEVRG